jgi:hypothetical protein
MNPPSKTQVGRAALPRRRVQVCGRGLGDKVTAAQPANRGPCIMLFCLQRRPTRKFRVSMRDFFLGEFFHETAPIASRSPP